MWTCPKCGREFKRQNQSHYCGNAPANIEEYIAVQEENAQQCLRELVEIFRSEVPDLAESIKWSMPYFQNDTGIISFAVCKKRVSLYVGEEIIEMFYDDLGELKHKKDALYFPYDKPLPVELIKHIVRKKLCKIQGVQNKHCPIQ